MNHAAAGLWLNGLHHRRGTGDTVDTYFGEDTSPAAAAMTSSTRGLASTRAIFSGNRADYTITEDNVNGRLIVTDLRGIDGTDTLISVNRLEFADQSVDYPVPGILLIGTEAADTLAGGEGTDRIDGAGGDDTLLGADGDDTLDGGSGDDALSGGRGNDTVIGGAGADIIVGDEGFNLLFGGEGDELSMRFRRRPRTVFLAGGAMTL